MIKPMKQTFKVTALAAALLAVYGPVLAEGLVLDPNSVAIGIGNWSNDRAQRGIFDGMRDSGTYGLLDADILRRDDATGTWLGLKARNLGLDNREIKLEWLRQGNIGLSLEYSRIPRDNPFTFNTGVTGIGTATLRVPTPSIVPGSGSNVELGTVRDRVTAKFSKNLGADLNLNVSFRNEEKDGTRQWGRGGAPEFAVEPISSTIQILEAALSYSRGPLQLTGGYYGTSYKNDYSLITTSLTSLAPATTYYLSQPMSNMGHEIFVNGGYNFTPTTRGSFKASYSRVTQDEHLPTGDIPGLAIASAPKNLDGRLDTTLLEVGLTAKPMPKLSVVANLRYRDFADKTPLHMYASAGGGVYNTPFSYQNTVGKLEATYRLPQAYSLLGGIEYNAQDRTVPNIGTLYVPFRAKLDETTYGLRLSKSMSEMLNGSLAYRHSERDGGSYKVPGDPTEPAENLINPLNISDRKRDKWRGVLDWSATERVNLQFAIEDSRDKYAGLPYGLQNGNAQLYSVDGSFQLSSDWTINAWVSRDETEAKETTQQLTGNIIKSTVLKETGDSFGVGVSGKVAGKLKLGGNLEQFRSVNKYNQTQSTGTLTAGLVPTPDITNTLLRLKLFAQYAVQKNADVRLDLIHEKWSTGDWSWMMFPASGRTPFAYGTTTDGTTVIANPKQNSTFVGVRYIYRFQ